MREPQARAARVRELFALALDTPPGGVDALLASEAGNDPGLIDEIKQLLSADAAAARFLSVPAAAGLAPWQRMLEALDAAASLPPDERRAFLASACADDDAQQRSQIEQALGLHDATGLPLESSILRTATLLGNHAESEFRRAESNGRLPSALEGRVVSHYRVDALLGAGGMGVVYSARDLALGRKAALKVLPDVFTPVIRERLLLEADASSRLQHPAIATYYESGEADGITFIAMEWVPGETLRTRLRRGRVTVGESLAWTGCVLEALSHAHAAGILHRDIKPENIMLTGPRSAKLLDFGLAKHLLLDDAATAATAHTAAAVAGTLGYMSPEQIRNDPQDRRSERLSGRRGAL